MVGTDVSTREQRIGPSRGTDWSTAPTGTGYRVEFDGDEERVSTAVVRAVAAITGRRQADLDSLYYVVNCDALDSLFRPSADASPPDDVEVSFPYHGFHVSVRSYGIIEIRRISSGERAAREGPS